jgi:alkylation response protein AidB-like acyl-CoA dehydrogenase
LRNSSKKNVCQLAILKHTRLTHQGVPADFAIQDGLGHGPERWSKHPPIIDELKAKAKALGLWNIFLSKTHYSEGAGLTNLEYALVAELLGRAMCASEVRASNTLD